MQDGPWQEREDDLEGQLNRGAMWAVTYGDMMSYLAIFFLVLYAASLTRSVNLQMSIKGVEEQFGGAKGVVATLFSRYGIQKIAKLEMNEERIRIVFADPVLFDAGAATLKESSRDHLARLAAALKDLPNPIQVEGHTDNVKPGSRAPFKSNWELSSARAFAVLRAFEKDGVSSDRLSAIGYGEFRPLKPNDTPEGRAANRRIEINILRRRN